MTDLRTTLLGTTAILLALGTTPAVSQDKPGASGGGAEVQSGAQTGAQTGQGGAQGSAQGGAQGSAQTGQGGAGAEAQGSARGEAGAEQQRGGAQGRAEGESQGETRGQARTGEQRDRDREKARGERKRDREEARGERKRDREKARGDRDRGGDTDVSVKFSSEHKTKVRSYFKSNRVTVDPVETASISVSVGGTVPSHISLHPLPQTVVVDLPPDAEYHYFVWGNDIVIVDARTHVVVDILYDAA